MKLPKIPSIPGLIALVEAFEKHPIGTGYLIALVSLIGAFSLLLVHR